MNKAAIEKFAVWARTKLISEITYKMGLLGITEKGIAEPLPQDGVLLLQRLGPCFCFQQVFSRQRQSFPTFPRKFHHLRGRNALHLDFPILVCYAPDRTERG